LLEAAGVEVSFGSNAVVLKAEKVREEATTHPSFAVAM